MATYKDVQDYTRATYGWVAKPCWIAHVKSDLGLPMRRSKRGDGPRVVPCPPGKREQVTEAMRAVGLI